MKSVLIVDNNVKIVNMLSRVLSPYQDLFTVLTANDGQGAIDIVEKAEIDLVLTELHLPGVNGIALIKRLLASGSGIPIIVMTAYGTPEIELNLNSIPNIKYFNKPLKMDAVMAALFERLEITFGSVDGVGLPSFLQLLEMESKTCTLSIMASEDRIGTLYILDGTLIAAETAKNKDEAAAYEILTWPDVKIHIVYNVGEQEQKITQSLMNILMECAKLEDEAKSPEKPAEAAQAPPSDGGPAKINAEDLMKSGPMAETLEKMKDALKQVIGPNGDRVFLDSLNAWADAMEPSASSLPSLIDFLDEEIKDPDKITEYRTMIEPFF